MKTLPLAVSEKKNFKVGLLCSFVLTCDPWGGAFFYPPGQHMIKRDKRLLLETTCQISNF